MSLVSSLKLFSIASKNSGELNIDPMPVDMDNGNVVEMMNG